VTLCSVQKVRQALQDGLNLSAKVSKEWQLSVKHDGAPVVVLHRQGPDASGQRSKRNCSQLVVRSSEWAALCEVMPQVKAAIARMKKLGKQ